MKFRLIAGLLFFAFSSSVALADCRTDCKETYKKDMNYCATLGDPNSRGNCITRANETYESCRAGCK